MYADDSVRQLSNPADVQAAFHSFIALCARKATDKNMKIRKRGKMARYEYRIFKGRKHHSTLEPCPVTARGAANANIPLCRELGSTPLIRCSSVNTRCLLTAYNPSSPLTKVQTTAILYGTFSMQLSYTDSFPTKCTTGFNAPTCYGCKLRPFLAICEC
jgi:hypothetical protein